MKYRIAYAGFALESVSSSPFIIDQDLFEKNALHGTELLEKQKGTNTVAGGVIEQLEEESMQCIPIFESNAGALGPASDNAVRYAEHEIITGLQAAGHLDGIVLFLHGACWAPSYPDVEKYIIDAVHHAFPDIPIVVALDYHGNVNADTFTHAKAAVAYHHSPHTDMGETGKRAVKILSRILRTGQIPGFALAHPNIVIPSIMSATALEPLASIIASARNLEKTGDCDISVMAGFAYADSPNTGMTVMCVDWDGQHAAHDKADQLTKALHAERKAISTAQPVMSVEQMLQTLTPFAPKSRPTVVLEHADRLNDSTHGMHALRGKPVGRVAVPFLFDPHTAKQAVTAGSGAEIQVALGGHSSHHAGTPLTATAKVIWSGEKSYAVSGRMMHGAQVNLGATALLEIDNLRISVVSVFAFAIDGDPFYIFNERPEDYDVILLRSKTHYRDFYVPRAEQILIIDTPDLGPANVKQLIYKQLNTSTAYPWHQ